MKEGDYEQRREGPQLFQKHFQNRLCSWGCRLWQVCRWLVLTLRQHPLKLLEVLYLIHQPCLQDFVHHCRESFCKHQYRCLHLLFCLRGLGDLSLWQEHLFFFFFFVVVVVAVAVVVCLFVCVCLLFCYFIFFSLQPFSCGVGSQSAKLERSSAADGVVKSSSFLSGETVSAVLPNF